VIGDFSPRAASVVLALKRPWWQQSVRVWPFRVWASFVGRELRGIMHEYRGLTRHPETSPIRWELLLGPIYLVRHR
jgi:hypothetical protein